MAKSRKHYLDSPTDCPVASKVMKTTDFTTSKLISSLCQEDKNSTNQFLETKTPYTQKLKVFVPNKMENPFTHVNLFDQKLDNIQGILALDMDDTILNYDETIKQGRTVFINEDAIKQLIQEANDKNILVVCVTSRYFHIDFIEDVRCTKTFATETLKELNANVPDIYYTNGQPKWLVLYHLAELYSLPKHRICLVDDLLENIQSCSTEGFTVIPVDPNSHSYLRYIQHFLNGKLLIDEEYYDDLHNFLNKDKKVEDYIAIIDIKAKIGNDEFEFDEPYEVVFSPFDAKLSL